MAAACGAAADDEDLAQPLATIDARPPVVSIEARRSVAAPDDPASARASGADRGAEAPGSPLEPLEWASLPPPGAYDAPFPFLDDGTPEQQRRWLRGRAEMALLAYCGQCHGPRAACDVDGDFGDVNDFDAIVEQGLLSLCEARNSPVVLRMLDRSMPPPGSSPVSASISAIVRDATDFGCVAQ
jgi:mono/diheme cytochrome c family protein